MLTRIAFRLILLLAAASQLAGQDEKKFVIWSERADCDSSESVRASSPRLKCSSVATDRGKVIGIEHEGLKLAILPQTDTEYFVIGVAIANATTDPFMFDSDQWTIADFHSLAEFKDDKPPIYRGRSIPSRAIMRGLRIEAQQSNSLDSYLASTQNAPKTVEYKRPDGSTGRTVIRVPSEDEQNRVRDRSGNRIKIAEERQEEIRKNSLTARSVMPESNIAGMVYFEKRKEAGLSILSLSIGNVTYVFGISRNVK